MKTTKIIIEIDDTDNEYRIRKQITLESYRDLKDNHNVEPIEMMIKEMNEEIDDRVEHDNKKESIVLGHVYHLDLGASGPVSVRPTSFTLDGRVVCEYLNSTPGRVGKLDIRFF